MTFWELAWKVVKLVCKWVRSFVLQQVFAECLLGDQTLLSRSLWSSRGNTWILIVMSVDKKDEEMCMWQRNTWTQESLKVKNWMSLDSLQAPKSRFQINYRLGLSAWNKIINQIILLGYQWVRGKQSHCEEPCLTWYRETKVASHHYHNKIQQWQ